MNLGNILTVYLKELRDSLRDRRTVMSMIIIPTLVMPLLFFVVGKVATGVFSKAKNEVAAIMVIGAENSPGTVAALEASPRLRIVPLTNDWKNQISEKQVRAAVEIPADFDATQERGEAPVVLMYSYEGELKSRLAVNEVEKILEQTRHDRVQAELSARGLPAALVEPFTIKWENVAPPEKVGGNKLGGLVPYMIIILCFTGAMYPAMDLTAGEKERGTMETLLCSPVARVDIVLGKFLMVLTSSLAAMILSLTSMGLTFAFAGRIFSEGKGAAAAETGGSMAMIDPMGVLGVLAMVMPVAVLFSAVLFTVALFAKSYKEAQSYVAPMIFVVIMPAIVGMLPGIDLNARLALVPILNLSLVCKEMLSGVWHWQYIAIIFGSTCVYAGIALALAVNMFKREGVIFRV